MSLINIGFGKTINLQSIVAIVSPDAAPIRRLISQAKEAGLFEDLTNKRKARSVIILENNKVILSALQPETIGKRATGGISGFIEGID